MTDTIVAICYDRDRQQRSTLWSVLNRTVQVEQHEAETPWNVYTQQRAFCAVQCNANPRPLDVATSSHAQAVRAYCYNVLRVPRDTVIQTDYDI